MDPAAKRNPSMAMLIAFVLIGGVFVLLTCAFQVRVTEAALVSTLGKPGEPIVTPGLYFKAPWPFQRVYSFDRRLQLFESGFREMLTRNGSNVIVRLFAAWSIDNPKVFYERVGYRSADGEQVLASLLDKHSSDVIGKHPLSSFVAVAPSAGNGIQETEAEIQARVLAEAGAYGMAIRMVGFEHLGLPDTITRAVLDRMVADRTRLTQKIRSEGEREAKAIRIEADQARAESLSAASAEATRIRGEADSEAYKNFEAFKSDPEFAIFLRKLEALEQTLKTKTTLILDRDMPPYDLLKDPGLDSTGK